MALFGAAAQANPTQGDISKDVELKMPPGTDSVSHIQFSPVADHIAVASWDNAVRIYEIDPQGNSQGKAEIKMDGPALSTCFSNDGQYVFAAGADKTVKVLDLANPGAAPVSIAQHDQPIKCIKWADVGGQQCLVTGSWDKTIKYWDPRTQNPLATYENQNRVYTMDCHQNLLVVGTADRYINIFNLKGDPSKPYKTMQSPLKWQTRVVSCFTDASGFAVGSIEGRCAIQYVEEKDSASNFSFKCHRANDPTQRDVAKVYSVNAISFHRQHGTFSTAGSDGTFHFWDKDAKHRLKGYPEVGGPITSTDFNHSGSIFAYAVSYDWSKGYTGNQATMPTKVMLHPVIGDECKPRPNSKKR
ncbi:WD40 repeat-like protein [Saccharata proteae CBS 121410]|uniref:WD40 repeat-like protein n=1 Tax=Saccharata proteae CBS 121410 TaxID=1314787 RepID=A0A9P4HQQ4_9PEZI|nr:WD40 repeat-like protein [Saccharata proteae CBS 121410]